MKQRHETEVQTMSLTRCDAANQVKIAALLMAVIPALSLFYLGMSTFEQPVYLPFLIKALILAINVILVGGGFLILRKYPDNILKLRQYITEIAKGMIPDKIVLADTKNSDDLRYIEENFNNILTELRNRIDTAEKQLQTEQHLRETIEQQQKSLLDAERHRVMIQTLGAACHHIGQPATVLQVRLEFLRNLATDKKEIAEIECCVAAIQQISGILHQLQKVSEFRTVPYTRMEGEIDQEILEIR